MTMRISQSGGGSAAIGSSLTLDTLTLSTTGAQIVYTSTGSLTIAAGATVAVTFNSVGAASFPGPITASNVQAASGSFSGSLIIAGILRADGSFNVIGGLQASNASVTGGLSVVGSYSVLGVSQFSAASFSGAVVVAGGLQASAASFVGQTVLGLGTAAVGSLVMASKQFSVAASAGSVLTVTWKNSAGNLYRVTLSGASV